MPLLLHEEVSLGEFVPALDLALLVRCANMNDQYDAVVAFAQAIEINA